MELQDTYTLMAGVDEAGRGPLAGPVYAAAVILNVNKPIDGLMDSKKLNEKKREILVEIIQERALAFAVARAEVEEIDAINILQASLLAMQRAVNALSVKPELALIDGNKCPKLFCKATAVVKGDALIPAISAASILAKVYRDREMLRMHELYPHYDFATHKGYGTKKHLIAIEKFGPCLIHRKTFAPIDKLILNNVAE